MNKRLLALILVSVFIRTEISYANKITANSSNYTTYISSLQPGDTLYLTAGTYANGLTINNINGASGNPIVIMGVGNTTVLNGRSCCNTISLTKCSYIVIKDMKVDGLNLAVDALKGEGTAGNWAHHITVENLYIVNHGNTQQIVGISTKCHAWDWIIRGNTIIGAGTGLYLGNSNGDDPFVNGLIENNLVMNTIGYNMEVKHQLDTVRDNLAGTSTDNQTTIIRYNVWSKASGASTGGNARPVVLVGAFPSTGYGANDHYEIYGNFFYENPVEALFQGTGNISMYSNVFVNHQNPSGYRAVYFTNHNSFQPRKINFFHNTVVSNMASGAVRLNSPNTSYQQYCYANAVCGATAISGFTNSVDNITDTYANAGTYINSASSTLSLLDAYPKSGQLQGASTSNSLFTTFTDHDKDFDRTAYNWTYRGAYSGSGTNPGWKLQMAIRTTTGGTVGLQEKTENNFLGMVYPNPANNSFELLLNFIEQQKVKVELANLEGQRIKTLFEGEMYIGNNTITTDVNDLPAGFYLITIQTQQKTITNKLLINK